MCLISVLPKGTIKYNKQVEDFISSGFKCNGDGSGYMYKKDGDKFVYINKGFFNLDMLLKSIKDLNLQLNDELVVHHRIGTAGAITASNTHPFVVSTNHSEVIMLSGKTNKPVLTHNGIFREIKMFENLNKQFSDTYAFARYILTNTIEDLINFQDDFLKSMDNVIGWSRMCLLFPDRDLLMTGDFKEDGGYYHSNTGYKSYVRNVGGVESNVVGFPKPAGGENLVNTSFLKLPPATKESKNIILNDNHITINEFNYSHFVFIRKDKMNNTCYRFDTYDENTLLNMMWNYVNSKPVIGMTVSKARLHDDYEFHPKTVYKNYYSEYIHLLMTLTPSKNLMKKIFKLLNTHRHKPLDYIFKIQKKAISKIALVNYYLAFKDKFMTDPIQLLDNGYSPIVSNHNLLKDQIVSTKIENTVQHKPSIKESTNAELVPMD